MFIDIIGFIFCAIGGGIIGKTMAKSNYTPRELARELAMSGIAMLCLIFGTMVVML